MALKSANQPIRWKERIGIFGMWHGAKYAESFFFDEFVYGAVNIYAITKFGTELGAYVTFMIMTPFTAMLCLLYLRLYDNNKTDLFGFEEVKEIRDAAVVVGRWKRFLRQVIRLGDFPAFVVLNCFWPNGDPFMATVYLRKGAQQFNGLTRRDWDIFWASVLAGNVYWTFRWTVLVVLATEFFWPALIRPALQWFGFN